MSQLGALEDVLLFFDGFLGAKFKIFQIIYNGRGKNIFNIIYNNIKRSFRTYLNRVLISFYYLLIKVIGPTYKTRIGRP